MYTLYADNGEDRKVMGRFISPASAAEYVDRLDGSGQWPEGYDAVMFINGVPHMYEGDPASGWVAY
jgi:hypothetical protein